MIFIQKIEILDMSRVQNTTQVMLAKDKTSSAVLCFGQLLSKGCGRNSKGSEVNGKEKTSGTKNFCLLKEGEEHVK